MKKYRKYSSVKALRPLRRKDYLSDKVVADKYRNSDAEYFLKYNSKLETTFDDINFLIENILNFTDISIEKDGNYGYSIKKENNKTNNSNHIFISITTDGISLTCENQSNNYYKNINLDNVHFLIKWKELLEEKYLDNLKFQSKSIFNEICSITKLNRKTRIGKLLSEDNEEEIN